MRWVFLVAVPAVVLAACGGGTEVEGSAASADSTPTQRSATAPVDQMPATTTTSTRPSTTTDTRAREPEGIAPTSAPAAPTTTTAVTTVPSPPAATADPPTSPATSPPATNTPSTHPPTAAAEPPAEAYHSEVLAVDGATAARMSASWREGCPVPLADLRLLRLSYWGYDGAVRTGELVVHADSADLVATVFARLFEVGYPIERMELVDAYGADDDASMAANNTSAFNCRTATGSDRWSEHAYGRAIDVNPRVNPYVSGSYVAPPAGAAYLDRSADAPGLIHAGDDVVEAFAAVGWTWGGFWSSPTDYQHFSASGR